MKVFTYKKIIIFILLSVLIFSFTGCEHSPTGEDQYTITLSVDGVALVDQEDVMFLLDGNEKEKTSASIGEVTLSGEVEITATHDDYTFAETITVDADDNGQEIEFSAEINSKIRTVATVSEFQKALDNEYIEEIAISDELEGDFELIEQVRDLSIEADDNSLLGNFTLGDGETTVTINLFDFDMTDELVVNVNKGNVNITDSSLDAITIESVGAESFNIKGDSNIDRLKNNSEGAKITIDQNANVELAQFTASSVIEGASNIEKAQKTEGTNVDYGDEEPQEIEIVDEEDMEDEDDEIIEFEDENLEAAIRDEIN